MNINEKDIIIDAEAENINADGTNRQDGLHETDELRKIKKELATQRKMLTAILILVILLTCIIGIYLLSRILIGAAVGGLVGLIGALFGN